MHGKVHGIKSFLKTSLKIESTSPSNNNDSTKRRTWDGLFNCFDAFFYKDPLPTLEKGLCYEGHILYCVRGTESWYDPTSTTKDIT